MLGSEMLARKEGLLVQAKDLLGQSLRLHSLAGDKPGTLPYGRVTA